MKEKQSAIQAVLEPIALGLGLIYLGSESIMGPHELLLRVYLDKSGGISVDDCARASRQMNAALIVEDILPEHYRLEVSSPGIERPLFIKAHYEAAVGQKIECRLQVAHAGRRRWTGLLVAVEGDDIELLTEEGTKQGLALSDIAKANVKPEIKVGG